MKKKLGTMISETMLNQNISQKDLCAGLCSTTAFSRYINGERHMDRLLLSVVLQRLGKSADKFATLMSEEEYVYFAWKQKVCVAQLHRDWNKISELLMEKEALDRTCNKVLQEQFYLIMRALVEEKLKQNHEESVCLLEKAIVLTVPIFEKGLDKHTLLGVQEIYAILLWQRLQPNREVSMRILEKLVNYTEIHYEDLQEKSKVYPKVVAQYLPILYEKEYYMECVALGKRALEIMASTGFTSGMETVLSVYIRAAEKIQMAETVTKEKKWLQAWYELQQEIGPEVEETDDGLYQFDVWQEIVLLHEMIHLNRKEQGYTQEMLSENICEPESLSRIETGKRKPNPKTYMELAKKLSLPEEYYFSTIETDDFEVLDLRWELEQCTIKGDWLEVENKLQQLEKKLDLNFLQNRQYVEEVQIIINQRKGKISAKDQLVALMNILNYTINEIPDCEDVSTWSENFWNHSFTEREMSILIQVADVLRLEGKIQQTVILLERMLVYYQKSKVQLEFHYRIIMLIMQRLSTCCGLLKEYSHELRYSEEGIKLSMVCGNRKVLPFFLNNKADALENMGDKKASLKFYKLAFYTSELLKTNTATIARRSYEKITKEIIKWY